MKVTLPLLKLQGDGSTRAKQAPSALPSLPGPGGSQRGGRQGSERRFSRVFRNSGKWHLRVHNPYSVILETHATTIWSGTSHGDNTRSHRWVR